VTTLESGDTLRTAAEFLRAFGFAADAEVAFQMDSAWRSVELKRGFNKLTRRGIVDWPQQVRLDWDRGRVDVAASIAPPTRTSSWNWSTRDASRSAGKRQTALMQELLLTIATALEILLSQAQAETAGQHLAQIDQRLQDLAAKERRRRNIVLFIVLGVVVAVFGLGIYLATHT
jgi:hypothetical protein